MIIKNAPSCFTGELCCLCGGYSTSNHCEVSFNFSSRVFKNGSNKFVWLLFVVCFVCMVFVFKLQRKFQSKKPGSLNENQPVFGERSLISPNLLAFRWVSSAGDLTKDGVMLTCQEQQDGDIENIYVFPGGLSCTQRLSFPAIDRLLGSEKYEELSRLDYEKRVGDEPSLIEVKEILEDFPKVRNSGLVYSGIREIYVLKTQFREIIRRHRDGDLLSFGMDPSQLVHPEPFEFKTIYFRARLEQMVFRNRVQRRLVNLYGEIPGEVFERLMSIQFLRPADELIDP